MEKLKRFIPFLKPKKEKISDLSTQDTLSNYPLEEIILGDLYCELKDTYEYYIACIEESQKFPWTKEKITNEFNPNLFEIEFSQGSLKLIA